MRRAEEPARDAEKEGSSSPPAKWEVNAEGRGEESGGKCHKKKVKMVLESRSSGNRHTCHTHKLQSHHRNNLLYVPHMELGRNKGDQQVYEATTDARNRPSPRTRGLFHHCQDARYKGE